MYTASDDGVMQACLLLLQSLDSSATPETLPTGGEKDEKTQVSNPRNNNESQEMADGALKGPLEEDKPHVLHQRANIIHLLCKNPSQLVTPRTCA